MRPLIEDVLDILREILTAYSVSGSGRFVSGVRLEAVRKVATRELAAHRFKIMILQKDLSTTHAPDA